MFGLEFCYENLGNICVFLKNGIMCLSSSSI